MSPTRHVPTVMDDPRDDLSEPDRALIEDVEKYGFHYITVGQSASGPIETAASRGRKERPRLFALRSQT